MIFSIGTEKLLYVMNRVGQVVDKKHTAPILANVLIVAEDNTVSFRSTDLNSTVEVTVNGEVAEDGASTVPVDTLTQIARVLPRDSLVQLSLDPTSEKVTVSSGMTSYVIASLPTADFPQVEEGEYTVNFDVKTGTLQRIFDKTRFAISTDESRMQLNGIFLHKYGEGDTDKLAGVAIDGFQMAVAKDDLPEGAKELAGIIIPEKAVTEFGRMFTDQPEVQVSTAEGRLKISAPGIVFITRLIDAQYPKFDRLIPVNTDYRLVVDANTLLNSLNRVSTIVSEGDCRISLDLVDGNLNLSASAFGRGQSSDTIPVDCNAPKLKIRFTSRSLTNILSLMKDSQATFLFNKDERAVLVLDSEDENCNFVVMPSR